MKPFAIRESHLTLSEVLMREQEEDYKPEKKVAEHCQRTDSIHINCKRVCTII